MYKKELRKLYKEKRKSLTTVEIESLQESIYEQVFAFDFSSVKKVHIFLPIEKQAEINTYPIISFLREKGKEVVISKSNFTNATLQHYLFEESTVLEINKYGIPEPVGATSIEVKEIDLVFVPLLISDEKNYRVGYGKGFYDRFLSDCKPNVITIGLNFFSPIEKIEDINEFDIALQHIIVPNE